MQWIVAGLGNPGDEYTGTRHNVGRDFLRAFEGKLPKSVKLVTPDVYMNNSGGPLKKLVPSKKAAEKLIVIHDELDLPLGRIKISYGSSAGGHNGVKSVQAALKTQDFTRVRVGISPSTPSGKLKRPDGEKIVDFVLGKFKPADQEKLKKAKKLALEAIDIIIKDGPQAAMMEIHSRG
ncbi:MAG TPA: aminoacyl-tRNA hydrolase [Candidatus Paceibacterota bacterium]|nr:aminoacyl-tRNA hydrolase [Candidatus Paceibacterota bacterium]